MKDELTKLADHVQATMSAELIAQKFAGIIVVMLYPDGSIKRMEMPPHVGMFLDSGRGKDIFYLWLRLAVRGMKVKGCATGTDAWIGRSTPAAKDIPREEWERLSETEGTEALEKRGLVTRTECLMVNVQTATEYLMRSVPYTRTRFGPEFAAAEDIRGPLDMFSGRGKVFDDPA